MKLTRPNLWGISRAGRANFRLDSEAKLEPGKGRPSERKSESDTLCLFGDGWVPGRRAARGCPGCQARLRRWGPTGRC